MKRARLTKWKKVDIQRFILAQLEEAGVDIQDYIFFYAFD